MYRNLEQTIYFEARCLATGEVVSGLTITASIVKDGGAPAVSTNAVSEIGTTGTYKLTLSATETDAYTAAVVLTPSNSGVFVPLVALEFDPVETYALQSTLNTVKTTVNAIPTLTYTVPTASENAAAVWNAKLDAFGRYATAGTRAGYCTLNSEEHTRNIPTSATNAQAVWDYGGDPASRKVTNYDLTIYTIANQVWGRTAGSTDRTLTASPTDVSSLATASALSDVASAVGALPTASDVGNAVWSAESRSLTTRSVGAETLATASDIQGIPALVCSEPLAGHTTAGTLGKVIQDTATATSAAAISSVVAEINTSVETINNTVDSMQNTVLTINSNVQAISGYTDELEEMVEDLPTASGISTAVWSETARTLTASPTDVSSLATAASIATLQTSVNVIPTATYTIPTDYARPGDAMGLTTAVLESVTLSDTDCARIADCILTRDISTIAPDTQLYTLCSVILGVLFSRVSDTGTAWEIKLPDGTVKHTLPVETSTFERGVTGVGSAE